MSTKDNGAANSELLNQINSAGESVCKVTQDGDKVTLVLDLGQKGLSVTGSGKSLLLASGAVQTVSSKYGDCRIMVNAYTKLTADIVVEHEEVIIDAAVAKAEKAGISTTQNDSKAVSILEKVKAASRTADAS